ncbi:SH3 domain of the SH3b1 type [Legionella donaldsonii]|uniref:SH3 domain of the SH3b1 type n=1 Tax=Legionella donaldsonii TaxID=45060 RepID=A0A378J4A0_9GAMM|nr:SH3 domain-containing C40 family peptidase [Legionella donaldsonii]STX42584.1 SH3 domain of the SH3b1 type [Legionella donaldsonii]
MLSGRLNGEQLSKRLITFFLMLFFSLSYAVEVPIYDFSIKAYTQNTNDYLPSDSADYEVSLLKPDYQAAQLQQFYKHYYATDAQALSPWSEQMVKSILPVVKKIELQILDDFDNQNKTGADRHYAENFKEHDESWLNQIKQNMDVYALDNVEYQEKNKAISVNNTYARALPDMAPDFFHFSLPGQGFPFDNLQESVIWAGTPLYVFAVSQDKAWSLVLTPDAYFAWVKSSDIAYASSGFIGQWQAAAQKGLVAITETGATVVDKQQHFQFTGYIGAVFPLAQRNEETISILIPVKNAHQQAVVTMGSVSKNAASVMPLAASKKNMAKLIKQLQNRPYGWGGAFFFNDCSQEMKSLFTPFGIWLPRNTAQQAKLSSTLDLSNNKLETRLNLLQQKGHPLMTIIYINGHVMLYVGKKKINQEVEAITYQNVWGLSPANGDKRYMIGQAVFLPLLKYYPENPEINSPANKGFFKLVYLDALDTKALSPQMFKKRFIDTPPAMNVEDPIL